MSKTMTRSFLFFIACLVPASFAHQAFNANAALSRVQAAGIEFAMVSPACERDFVLEKYGKVKAIPGAGVQLILNDSLISTLKKIQAQRGRVVVDCALFAQIAALILTEKAEGKFLFAHGELRVDLAPSLFGVDFAYVGLTNMTHLMQLQETHFSAKGQWLIRVGEDSYLGLGDSGVMMGNAQEWIKTTKAELFREIDADLQNPFLDCADYLVAETPGGLEKFSADYFDMLRKSGLLEDWTVRHYPR